MFKNVSNWKIKVKKKAAHTHLFFEKSVWESNNFFFFFFFFFGRPGKEWLDLGAGKCGSYKNAIIRYMQYFGDAFLMSTHNICFRREIKNNYLPDTQSYLDLWAISFVRLDVWGRTTRSKH